MSSPAKIRANRLNATKSTGPKSSQGKQRVSQNALDLGLHAKTILLPTENQHEYIEFAREILKQRRPQGPAELRAATEIAEAWWKIGRLRAAERAYLEDLIQIEAARDTLEENLMAISVRESDEDTKAYRRRIDEELLEEGFGSIPTREHLRSALKRTVSDEDHMRKSHFITLKHQALMRSIRFAEDALEKMQARRLTVTHSSPAKVGNANSLHGSDLDARQSDPHSADRDISKANLGDANFQDLLSATDMENVTPAMSDSGDGYSGIARDKAIGAEQKVASFSLDAIMERVFVLCSVLDQSTTNTELTNRWANELSGLMERFDWERYILPAALEVHARGKKPDSLMFLSGTIVKLVNAAKAGSTSKEARPFG